MMCDGVVWLGLCVCVCVYVCVCIYVCVYVCVCVQVLGSSAKDKINVPACPITDGTLPACRNY